MVSEFGTPNPNVAKRISPLQKTVLGGRFAKSFSGFRGLNLQEQSKDGDRTTYTYASAFKFRDNIVMTRQGVVEFERLVLPQNPNQMGFSTMSYFKQQFGTPDMILRKPTFFGQRDIYIYSTKGFAVVGDTESGQAYELDVFDPTGHVDFWSTYGEKLGPLPPLPTPLPPGVTPLDPE